MAEKTTDIATREQQRLSRREPAMGSPFRILDRFADEMERVFEDVGFGRSLLTPRWGRSGLPSSMRGVSANLWVPDVELSQRNNELVIRADLPGMNKNDVRVDVTEDSVTIQGERQQEEETQREGLYRSERSYGSFCRTIQLPEGAITDRAKASFKDGVLEITMPAPPEQVTRGRRLEINEGTQGKK